MSQRGLDNFRRGTAAYNDGDWEAALALMDPKVEVDMTRAAPDGETYRGYEGVKTFWRMLAGVFGTLRVEPEEIVDGGNRLFTRVRLRGTGQMSGAMTEDVLYQVISLHGDRAIRLEYFRDRAEALEAVGLSEEALKAAGA
jgi:ketosteroid isomerase-like protein